MTQRNFGTSVQDVLKRLDLFFVASQNSMAGNSMFSEKETLIAQVEQVLFVSKDSKKPKLSAFNELELANEICVYCARQKTEYVRYQVFDALFSMARHSSREHRKHILVITTSLAIALKSIAALECVALWLTTSPKHHAIHLVSCIENDFCSVMPDSSSELKTCNKICEKFCSIIICAFCAKYTMKNPENIARPEYPPHVLLDIIQHWVLDNPQILFCIITKMNQLWHTVLTTTRNPTDCLPLSPLSGVIQWCTKLPFAPNDFINAQVDIDYQKLHSRLHFGTLTAISASAECQIAIKQGNLGKESDFQLWSKSDAHSLVGVLLAYASRSPDPDSMNLSVERFAQLSQVAMHSKVLTISKEQFQSLTDPLPKTRLLELVAYGFGQKPAQDDVHMV